MATNPRISVIILSWNGRGLLHTCLQSLCQQTSLSTFEIIVVDNGSSDGSAHMVAREFPYVRLLALPINRGFAGGVNAALHIARGAYIALFNNDATAPANYLQELERALDSTPHLGAVGGVLVFDHQPSIIASAGINMYTDGVALDRLMLQPLATLDSQPQPIWGASGGSVLYRRRALQDVGIFDEGYFAYLEDVDLAWRLQARGWQVAHTPSAVARHIYSATGGEGSALKRWLIARNRWRVLGRCWPTRLLQQHWVTIMRYDVLACSQAALKGHWATINGRHAAWREWSRLRQQHHELAQRFTTPIETMNSWLQPTRSIKQTLATARQLHTVMQAKSS